MAKSSLMKILRRAYGIARMSKKTGIPSDELLGMVTEAQSRNFRTTRRRLLQGGLGFAGAMAASNFFKGGQRAMAQQTPVLIVGAGIAGLTAAYRLTQAGVPVNIIEARNRVGGRIKTMEKVAGTFLSADLGGEYIDSDHAILRSLAAELGLTEVDLFVNQEGLAGTAYYFGGRFVPEAELVADVAPVVERIEADLEAIDEFEDYTTLFPEVIELDNLSITEYLDSIETTPLMRQILRVAYSVLYGSDPDVQSSLNLIYFLGLDEGTFAPFGISDERYVIPGGNQQITNQLATFVSGSIETGTVLEAINSLSDGSYQVSLRSGNSSFDRIYERIVITLPFSVLREVQINVDLPPAKRLAIDTMGYAPSSKLITAYRDRIWRDFGFSSDVYSDVGFQNIEEAGQSRAALTPGAALLTNYSGGTIGTAIGSGTAEQQAQQQLSQYELVYPGISNTATPGNAVRVYWPGDIYSRGAYSSYLPGQWTQMYGVEGERVGNLFFAGEHTSLEYQGYMEGGCETGEIAAMEILEDLGLQGNVEAMRVRRASNLSNQETVPRRPKRAARERNRFTGN
ncbi:MAG: FAD-dependent oxidoreductase [Okeania sp. SIO3C4]|nr:FAD-dependent oxidoreductase [Okeania sp. SIO3B3]NER03829.1 FAD-dependent oxidoreductase [Okeania sp. SIO3C4]